MRFNLSRSSETYASCRILCVYPALCDLFAAQDHSAYSSLRHQDPSDSISNGMQICRLLIGDPNRLLAGINCDLLTVRMLRDCYHVMVQ